MTKTRKKTYLHCKAAELGVCPPGALAAVAGLCQSCWEYVTEYPPDQFQHDELALPDPDWVAAEPEMGEIAGGPTGRAKKGAKGGGENTLARWAEMILPQKPEAGEVVDVCGPKAAHRQHHGFDGRANNGQHNREKVVCPAGHVHDRVNNRGARYCTECRRIQYAQRQAALGRVIEARR